jgi:hypothetical protein
VARYGQVVSGEDALSVTHNGILGPNRDKLSDPDLSIVVLKQDQRVLAGVCVNCTRYQLRGPRKDSFK